MEYYYLHVQVLLPACTGRAKHHMVVKIVNYAESIPASLNLLKRYLADKIEMRMNKSE